MVNVRPHFALVKRRLRTCCVVCSAEILKHTETLLFSSGRHEQHCGARASLCCGLWLYYGTWASSQCCITVDIITPAQPQIPKCGLHGQPGNIRPAARHLLAHEGLLLRHGHLAAGLIGVYLDHSDPSEKHQLQLHLHHLHLRGPPAGCGVSSEVTPSSNFFQRLESCCVRLAVRGSGEHSRECDLFKIFDEKLCRTFLF